MTKQLTSILFVLTFIVGPTYAGQRFTIAEDGTVADAKGSLTWQQNDDGVMRNWAGAEKYCGELVLGGKDDWRLPAETELMGLVDNSTSNPALDATIFPKAHSFSYWTGTPLAGVEDVMRRVNFAFGDTMNADKSAEAYTRCVR